MKSRIISAFIVQKAKEFWETVGPDQSVPCDIEQAVALVLPLNIVTLSNLSFHRIQDWFRHQGVTFEMYQNNRLIHGFLTCTQGEGIIFVNGTDSDEERRFTVAHEASHFIIEYLNPRQIAVKKFGLDILNVLDGFRTPTIEERVDGIIKRISLKPFSHLLEKSGSGSFASYYNWSAENNADALAVELLAPNEKICAAISSNQKKLSYPDCQELVTQILINDYLLPQSIASQYSARIAYTITGGMTIIDKLGLRG